jgi:hypothetical protein
MSGCATSDGGEKQIAELGAQQGRTRRAAHVADHVAVIIGRAAYVAVIIGLSSLRGIHNRLSSLRGIHNRSSSQL